MGTARRRVVRGDVRGKRLRNIVKEATERKGERESMTE